MNIIEKNIEYIRDVSLQEEISNFLYDEKKEKTIKRISICGYVFLGIFLLLGIVSLCLIQAIKIKDSDLIFGLTGAGFIILSLITVFITPCINYLIISKQLKKHYNYTYQAQLIKKSLSKNDLFTINSLNYEQNRLNIQYVYNSITNEIVYGNEFILLKESNVKRLINHNLNILIKVYLKDVNNYTSIRFLSFIMALEYKIKAIAIVILKDLITIHQITDKKETKQDD